MPVKIARVETRVRNFDESPMAGLRKYYHSAPCGEVASNEKF